MRSRRDFRHDSTTAPPWRAELMHWFAVLLLLALSGVVWQRIDAATLSKLTVSAIVLTRCNVVVTIVNGAPVVSNTCGASPAGSVDGRASVTVSAREHLIEVNY